MARKTNKQTKARTQDNGKAKEEEMVQQAITVKPGETVEEAKARQERQARRDAQPSEKMAQRARQLAARPHNDNDGFCECGCGGQPKRRGSRFLPGHDSRARSALTGPRQIQECRCGCGGYPRSARSRYLPGHDAKHLSKLASGLRQKDGQAKQMAREAEAAAAAEAEAVTVS